jgi:hypothetical protein
MSDWGVIVKSTTGDTLISPDSRTYEFVGEYTPYSRTGNISLYDIPGAETPIVFLQCGQGNAAGILAVERTETGHRVTALSTSNCSAQVFRVMADDASGYGVASYDRSGRLAFSSARNVLNVRGAGVISEGSSFSAPANTDMVSYTCGPVRPASSTTDRWVFVQTYTEFSTDYQCGFETVCRDQTTCGLVRSCSDSSPGFEICIDVFECTTTTVCNLEFVCRSVFVSTQYFVYAAVRRTNWHIDRGTARITSTQVGFDWTRHLTGFYDTVLYYTVDSFSTAPFGGTIRPGYVPPGAWITGNVFFEGQLTQNNTFPYTTSRANEIPLTCLASVRSNYD